MPSPSQALPRPLPAPLRWLLLSLAVLCLVLGFVGVVVPVLPTVPFLLLAAWAAARSSPRLDQWLHEHPRFGHHLRAWRDAGVVPRRAKWLATGMMGASGVLILLAVRPLWAPVLAVACMAAVAAWLWRRPEAAPGSPA